MQNKEVLLSDIASVRTGYTFREKIKDNTTGEIAVIQPKDIIDGNTITESISKVDKWEITPLQNHLLKQGDILIANKGIRFSIFLYPGSPSNCIASSSFFVISSDQDAVIPKYLAWFLEQEPAKNHLTNKASGSIIPSINKSTIQQLLIRLPSLIVQQKIVELLAISSKELDKLTRLRALKSEFYNSYIWEKVNGDLS